MLRSESHIMHDVFCVRYDDLRMYVVCRKIAKVEVEQSGRERAALRNFVFDKSGAT